VLFPDSHLRIIKRRSTLVVQADDLQTGLPQTIVAMITSNLARAGHSSRVLVKQNSPEGARMGLLKDSVVMCDNLATIRENEIDRTIGQCPVMPRVDDALRATFAL